MTVDEKFQILEISGNSEQEAAETFWNFPTRIGICPVIPNLVHALRTVSPDENLPHQ